LGGVASFFATELSGLVVKNDATNFEFCSKSGGTMRFILNFFFFGILFYLIYLFFPDAFHTLVSWADRVYEFLKDLFMTLSERFHAWRHSSDSNLDKSLFNWINEFLR